MSFSDYAENKILNHITGKDAAAWAQISNAYLSLHTGDPGDDGTSNEVSGGNYSRKQTSPSDWNTASGSGGSVTNAADITFATPSADWGTVSYFALWDAAAGNCLMIGTISPAQTIESGNTVVFKAGDLTLTVS